MRPDYNVRICFLEARRLKNAGSCFFLICKGAEFTIFVFNGCARPLSVYLDYGRRICLSLKLIRTNATTVRNALKYVPNWFLSANRTRSVWIMPAHAQGANRAWPFARFRQLRSKICNAGGAHERRTNAEIRLLRRLRCSLY
jgi:hypothetical protein